MIKKILLWVLIFTITNSAISQNTYAQYDSDYAGTVGGAAGGGVTSNASGEDAFSVMALIFGGIVVFFGPLAAILNNMDSPELVRYYKELEKEQKAAALELFSEDFIRSKGGVRRMNLNYGYVIENGTKKLKVIGVALAAFTALAGITHEAYADTSAESDLYDAKGLLPTPSALRNEKARTYHSQVAE